MFQSTPGSRLPSHRASPPRSTPPGGRCSAPSLPGHPDPCLVPWHTGSPACADPRVPTMLYVSDPMRHLATVGGAAGPGHLGTGLRASGGGCVQGLPWRRLRGSSFACLPGLVPAADWGDQKQEGGIEGAGGRTWEEVDRFGSACPSWGRSESQWPLAGQRPGGWASLMEAREPPQRGGLCLCSLLPPLPGAQHTWGSPCCEAAPPDPRASAWEEGVYLAAGGASPGGCGSEARTCRCSRGLHCPSGWGAGLAEGKKGPQPVLVPRPEPGAGPWGPGLISRPAKSLGSAGSRLLIEQAEAPQLLTGPGRFPRELRERALLAHQLQADGGWCTGCVCPPLLPRTGALVQDHTDLGSGAFGELLPQAAWRGWSVRGETSPCASVSVPATVHPHVKMCAQERRGGVCGCV